MASTPGPEVLQTILSATRLIAEIRVRTEARAAAAHERFNVFTTLLKADDEVRLHTRFLHALLDPNGLHDCGSLFLELFFSTLAKSPGVDHGDNAVAWQAPQAGELWTVEKEAGRSSGHGQIDLLLTHPAFAIAIENKIHAREQDSQLSSYAELLKARRGDAVHLVYLTKDGKKSASDGGCQYMRISYRDHILPWLEACLRETYRFVPVNQVLLQYREVVREIIGQTMETTLMKPVIEFVAQNPDIIRYRQQLVAVVEEAKATFLDQLAAGIVLNLKQDYEPRLRDNHEKGRFGRDPYGDILIGVLPRNPLLTAPFQIYVEHDTDEEALLIGIFVDNEGPAVPEALRSALQRMDQELTQHSVRQGYHKEKATDSWPVGWHNLMDGLDDYGFASLIAKPLSPLVNKICDEVRDYLKVLEAAYVKAFSPMDPKQKSK